MTAEEIVNKWIGAGFPDDDAAVKEAAAAIRAGLQADIEIAILEERERARHDRKPLPESSDPAEYPK